MTPFHHAYLLFPPRARKTVRAVVSRLVCTGVGRLPNPVANPREREATKELTVVVPVFNGCSVTARCFCSLERFQGDAEVVVIDDASTDPATVLAVRDACQRNGWKLHRHPVNRQHSGACTTGAALASRPFICFLNSDTVVTQHAFGACVQALRESRRLLVVAPRTASAWAPESDSFAGICRYRWTDAQIFAYADRLHRRYGGRPPRSVSPALGGCAFMLRTSDWHRLGGFSGCRPHYGNDLDFSAKVLGAGGLLAICDAAYIHHTGRGSFGDWE